MQQVPWLRSKLMTSHFASSQHLLKTSFSNGTFNLTSVYYSFTIRKRSSVARGPRKPRHGRIGGREPVLSHNHIAQTEF